MGAEGRGRVAVIKPGNAEGTPSRDTTVDGGRRLLLMVAELHSRGFERLRIVPGLAPSGCYWRSAVTPSSNVEPGHGALMLDRDGPTACHSSGYDEFLFSWDDAPQMSVSQLADAFVQRFPQVADEGRGADPAYVEWYAAMLVVTAPSGLPIAFHDWGAFPDCLHSTQVGESVCIPFPPAPPAGHGDLTP